LDLLGQGRSWPDGPVTPDQKLCYSIELWRDQILHFIRDTIKEPVHIAGNSLGGYLAVTVASTDPKLIKSVVLLNPTPFWAFNTLTSSKYNEKELSSVYDINGSESFSQSNALVDFASNTAPESTALKAAMAPESLLSEDIRQDTDTAQILSLWDGTLPAPRSLLQFGSTYFDTLRRPETVNRMLQVVYSDKKAIDQSLVNDIITSASNVGGHEAFTSILFSPKYKYGFDDMLAAVGRCHPVCLVYGKEDPWIVPYWGQRAKRVLPHAPYFELSPTGHCPHHESPLAVNSIMESWTRSVDEADDVDARDDARLELVSSSASDSLKSNQDKAGQMPRNVLEMRPRHHVSFDRLASVVGLYQESSSRDVRVELVDGQPRNILERVGAFFHRDPELSPLPRQSENFNKITE